MTTRQIRQSFLDFFEARGHRIVPSAPVIPHGDPTLLFTNAGMNQFKDVFLGKGSRDYVRAADTQKCIRVSGKHNDLEEVGRDTYHHTFFEMLGNWSFGDYYKREAIAWAWELLTGVWGLEKRRLYATVFETDEEAAQLWRTVTDIDPAHIQKFGKKDNFWEMGETGPCGPCSEIHIDLTPDGDGARLVNAGDPRVMEIWNLVFIQHNRVDATGLEDLPAKHVDTGMGFERICAVLQEKGSNYETDLFTPLIARIREETGVSGAGESQQVALQVIADHIRMLSFSLADGALPGNEGRGYVLRRILRRAARFGRNLGMHEPFIYRIAPAVAETLGPVFPEVVEKQEHIQRVIRAEEESFGETLDRGLQIFESVLEQIGHSTVFPGEDAFKLYDTFGFPLDLTQMMAQERGLSVDVGIFTELMEEQRQRAREAGKTDAAREISVAEEDVAGLRDSAFVGYDRLETDAAVEKVVDGKYIVLDRTPFYVEAGGQVDDTGTIESGTLLANVVDSVRLKGKILHEIQLLRGSLRGLEGERVLARVDGDRRLDIERNHTATHLVHEALRRVLGSHLHQQGSLVAPDRLRFDFNHFERITPDQLRAIEDIVNETIARSIAVNALNDPGAWLTIDEARHRYPNVKMFFGDKYGDRVRIVEIDPAFSVELCGGTHVDNTRSLGLFKIVSESGIASGIRRIEAVTGAGVRRYLEDQQKRIGALDETLDRLAGEVADLERQLGVTPRPHGAAHREPASLDQLTVQTVRSVDALLQEREERVAEETKHLHDLQRESSKRRVRDASTDLADRAERAPTLDGMKLFVQKVAASSMDELKGMADTVRAKLGSGVGILAAEIDGKAAFVCVVTDDLIGSRGLHAGKIVGALARRVGGGGGGRPHLATAGGKEIGKIDQALAQAPEILRGKE